jgi:protein gp37
MNKTKIDWTTWTWNPITGCLHGCWFCYAAKIPVRFPKRFPNGFNPTFWPERLYEPWELKKPSKIFVCSIADIFAAWTPEKWRDLVLESIKLCPVKHIFQLLTKNPERIPDIQFPDNVWIGCTVTQPSELDLIDSIKKVKAKVRFASFEPLLGPINMLDLARLRGLEWAIIGKLTGSRKVQLRPEWVYDLVDTMTVAGVPVFMKNNLYPIIPKEAILQAWPGESD